MSSDESTGQMELNAMISPSHSPTFLLPSVVFLPFLKLPPSILDTEVHLKDTDVNNMNFCPG